MASAVSKFRLKNGAAQEVSQEPVKLTDSSYNAEQNPHGLITAFCWPHYHKHILEILQRGASVHNTRGVPTLNLETNSLVQKLFRSRFASSRADAFVDFVQKAGGFCTPSIKRLEAYGSRYIVRLHLVELPLFETFSVVLPSLRCPNSRPDAK